MFVLWVICLKFASEIRSSELAVSELFLRRTIMEFFDRENEIQRLREIRRQSQKTAQFTVITGRRRIGKTSLVMRAYGDEPLLYFFVSRSSETELCSEFAAEIKQKLGFPVLGKPEKFADVFLAVMEFSKQKPLTLVIDEFQDFNRVNGAVFSQMQKIWDMNKNESKLNLIVCGSVYSMISRLFRDHKESRFRHSETHQQRRQHPQPH